MIKNFGQPLEPEWKPLVNTLAAMITLAPEFTVLRAYTTHDRECGPYVQTLQEADGAFTLEAASNQFLDPPIGPDAINTLIEMGWDRPHLDGLPNFNMFIESEEAVPGDVAQFLVKTLRDVYLVSPKDSFEMAPMQLFVDVLNGEYGEVTTMQFAPFDLEEWKRNNPRRNSSQYGENS